MPDRMRKVLHAFAALADLGEEIAETRDFEEMVRSALHVVLGALGVRRGAVAEVDREASSLRFVAARGFGESLPPDVSLTLKAASARGAKADGNGAGAHAPSKQELARVEREVREQLDGGAVE